MAIDTSATRQMLTREKFDEECRQMFNDICLLYDSELVRLVGTHEDDSDLYYKVVQKNGSILHASAVGACVSLKDIYPRYDQLETHFNLNVCQPYAEFEATGSPDEKFDWSVYDDPEEDFSNGLTFEDFPGC